MYKLFIDTHDQSIIYGLYLDEVLIKNIECVSGRRHGDTAMPALDKFLKDAGIKTADINEIIVDVGPGSFTGVRIGVTIAKMLAYTLNITIKTITSLELYSLNYDEEVLMSFPDHKGYYCGIFDKGKQKDELFYLNNKDYEKYISNCNIPVKNCEVINYDLLGHYILTLKEENVHAVKPIYVKIIEALK